MELVTLVNRTSKALEGTWDGRHYELKPGKHAFPRLQAEAFKRQNPLMGSLNHHTGYQDFLLGIEEDHDPCTALEQSTCITQDQIPAGMSTIPGRTGLFAHERQANLPLDSTFVEPNK